MLTLSRFLFLSAFTTIPELVISTNSLVPPKLVHKTGKPDAIASTTAFGQKSIYVK